MYPKLEYSVLNQPSYSVDPSSSFCYRQLRSHHAVMLLNLCVALILGHTFFLMGNNGDGNMPFENQVSLFGLNE